MEVKLFNTMSRTVEVIETIEKDKASLYCCGPTVYNYAHIGNLRCYIFEDVLRRTLEAAGYKVKHVMNITDVGHLASDADDGEDKMVQSAREQKKSIWDVAQFYTDAFFRDTARLNIKRPTVTPKATDHIGEMIKLIKKLEEKGFTYLAGGNVYFNIDKYEQYGQLARLDLNELKAGSRISVDANKKNPLDFVLWFTRSKFENHAMLWDSPWGKGYPGWHIECSAMSMKYLGEQFDIHCGGIDHVPVHHTNEIAQSEAATGKKWVNYWVHNEFLVTPKGKMSKSSGDFSTLEQLIKNGYDPLDYRYFCLQGQYRTQLQYSPEALDSARNSRQHLMNKAAEIKEAAGEYKNLPLGEKAAACLARFNAHAFDDLNTPRSLSEMWGLIKDNEIPPGEKMKALGEMDKILGLDLEKAEVTLEVDEEIKALIDQRQAARKNKDFARADEIRDLLLARGLILEDTPQGVRVKKK